MNAVGGKPRTLLEGESGARLLAQRRHHGVEVDILPAPQALGQDADEPPVILAAHREEQVEAFSPEVHVDLVGDHASGHLGIGDKEYVLVGSALKRDVVELSYGAARAIAARDPRRGDRPSAAVRLLERYRDAVGLLLEADQFGIPLHLHPERVQLLAHDALVVVLAKDKNIRIGGRTVAGIAERHMRHPPPLRPHVGAAGGLSELDRSIDNPEALVDFQRARLHAECACLARWPGVPVDDPGPRTLARELVGEHEPGRACADDEDVSVHSASRNYPWRSTALTNLVATDSLSEFYAAGVSQLRTSRSMMIS